MNQTTESIRIEQFLNASNDLAEVLGAAFEGATLKIKMNGTGSVEFQASRLHEKLQDKLGFLVVDAECTDTLCVYRKDKLTITFDFEV